MCEGTTATGRVVTSTYEQIILKKLQNYYNTKFRVISEGTTGTVTFLTFFKQIYYDL